MSKLKKKGKAAPTPVVDGFITPTYGFDEFNEALPQSSMPQESMDPRVAKKLIDSELDMDFRNCADLGSYITDYMDPEADALIQRALGKVFIDKAEYPRTAEMARRIGRMVQNWYNGTPPTDPEDGTKLVGTVTIGSSEAIHLGMITARRNWEIKWKDRLANTTGDAEYYRRDKPIFIYGREVHTCFKKFENYFGAIGVEINFDKDSANNYQIDNYTLSLTNLATMLV